jgi:hypothetical protein
MQKEIFIKILASSFRKWHLSYHIWKYFQFRQQKGLESNFLLVFLVFYYNMNPTTKDEKYQCQLYDYPTIITCIKWMMFHKHVS